MEGKLSPRPLALRLRSPRPEDRRTAVRESGSPGRDEVEAGRVSALQSEEVQCLQLRSDGASWATLPGTRWEREQIAVEPYCLVGLTNAAANLLP